MNTVDASDAALVWIKNTNKALALTVDCNSAYVYANPNIGAQIAVAEAARNIVCSGGQPLAITNCLNFGNPYDQEVYWQFVETIKGMGIACRAFNTPVTGGNVSFYNQSQIGDLNVPVYPTPTIGMLGLLATENKMTLSFKESGLQVYLVGPVTDDIGSSEYVRSIHKISHSPVPHFELGMEIKVQEAIKTLIELKQIVSAHDVSEGGLLICLFESCLEHRLGMDIQSIPGIRPDSFLFGEGQSRVVIGVRPAEEPATLELLGSRAAPYHKLGTTQNDGIFLVDGQFIGEISVWSELYKNRLSDLMES